MKEQSEFVQKVPTGFCAGYFVKVPTTYLLGMSWANWWALFENDQYVPAGYFAGQIGGYFSKVPTIYLLGVIALFFSFILHSFFSFFLRALSIALFVFFVISLLSKFPHCYRLMTLTTS